MTPSLKDAHAVIQGLLTVLNDHGVILDNECSVCMKMIPPHSADCPVGKAIAFCDALETLGASPSPSALTEEYQGAHEAYCNASRREPVGCDGCSCRAGSEIRKLRAGLASVLAKGVVTEEMVRRGAVSLLHIDHPGMTLETNWDTRTEYHEEYERKARIVLASALSPKGGT